MHYIDLIQVYFHDVRKKAKILVVTLQVIYCYGDLVPRQGELFAEGGAENGKTSSKDLLAAQLGLWTFGIFAL